MRASDFSDLSLGTSSNILVSLSFNLMITFFLHQEEITGFTLQPRIHFTIFHLLRVSTLHENHVVDPKSRVPPAPTESPDYVVD